FYPAAVPRPPPSSPTRRSSDLDNAPSASRSSSAPTASSPAGAAAAAASSSSTSRGRRASCRKRLRQTLCAIAISQCCGRFRQERSEEHTSELQSLRHLVCRLLL